MSVPSYERFDYQLRANKHIERRIVFDLLQRASAYFKFENYIGLGSMWFTDHRLAHKLLGIDNLTSIEAQNHQRAEFNKPYGSVTVLAGMSHDVLPLHKKWDGRTIVWMDYDGNLVPDVAKDLELFTQKLTPGSVLIFTVNSTFSNYRKKGSYVEAQKERGISVDPRAIATVATILESEVPEKFSEAGGSERSDATTESFSSDMAHMVFDFISHKLNRSGRVDETGNPLTFVPLFNIAHQDGAEMLTLGGVICFKNEAETWGDIIEHDPILRKEGDYIAHHRLDLIPITLREKLMLDMLLPQEEQPFIESAVAKGIQLPADQIAKYRLHYRHFPVFVETPI
jgi:hypothetical protein